MGRPKIINRTEKTCKKCGISGPLDLFIDGKLICRDCLSLHKKKYYVEKIQYKHTNKRGRPKKINCHQEMGCPVD